ncbi:MAG: hypothetical protein IJL97_05235, partial [Lachnospiraceae bacterium]|nr:hypothetical protein [Lachnospiraceae bacterium]
MIKKRLISLVIVCAMVLTAALPGVRAFAEEAVPQAGRDTELPEIPVQPNESDEGTSVTLSEISIGMDGPVCGTVIEENSSEEPSLWIEAYSGTDSFDEVVTADNAIWVSEYSGDTYVPFTGTIDGEKTYSAYATLKAAEGYRFSNDIEVYFGEPASGEVISKNDKEIVIAVSIAAGHDIDWDSYESTSATCMSPGSESYTCTGCGRHIFKEKPVNPKAHDWGEGETVKEASHLETGLKSHTCT